ncbi:MAG: glycosyltransferase family 4 protein [Candidatus Cohnella colombiensis]|uniref:Glycosyltransferase family 4 protein n=1 Tax=Candidatus Cohnella colombiensis TaxID=3121368 RepID=A0AA95EVD6_9BACL|nr:MAG: glycosyltransferase family 4 protein [Cohnella sp.]
MNGFVTEGRQPRVQLYYAVTVPISIVLLKTQLAEMKRRGYEVTLICSPGLQLEELEQQEGIHTYPLKMSRTIAPLSDIVSLWKLVQYLRKHRPDIINIGTPKAGFLVGIAAWLARVPHRVHTQHGLRLETLKGWKRHLLFATEKTACLAAHRVWCVSNSIREIAIQSGIVKASKSFVLGYGSNNGVDMARFPIHEVQWKAKVSSLRKEWALSSEIPTIGFVGRLTMDKGIIELLQTFDELRLSYPQLKLVLVGAFDDADPIPEWLRERIVSDSNIVKVGYQQEPAPYFSLMDVFVFPTYREGFGTVIIEASAAEVPVVTTNVTGAKDAVKHNESGIIVNDRDVKGLTEAVALLLRDKAEAKRLGTNGRQRVIEYFRSEVIWDAVDQLYQDMLNGK